MHSFKKKLVSFLRGSYTMPELTEEEKDFISKLVIREDGELLFPGDGIKNAWQRKLVDSLEFKGIMEEAYYNGRLHLTVPPCYEYLFDGRNYRYK